MEGLIPFLIHTIKRQKLHQHSFRCLSDGSRRSYHLLESAGDSFNGSSHHRRTQSEFMAPAAVDFQSEVEEFVRSRSFKTSNSNNNNNYGLRQTHYSGAGATQGYGYGYGQDHNKQANGNGSIGIKKAHKN